MRLVPAPLRWLVPDSVRQWRYGRDLPPRLRPYVTVPGMISDAEAVFLHGLASKTTSAIVEVGSYRGRSTVALATGAPEGVPVFAVDPHEPFVGVLGGIFGPEDRAAFFKTMLKTGCYQNVRLVNLPSSVAAQGWHMPIDLLWIDGDHRYEGVRGDFDAWTRHLTDDAVVVFDDATNQEIGPARVVAEALADGWKSVGSVGKVKAITRS